MPSPASVVAELAERARETGRLGVDTEFVGEGRYRPLLCLVQVAVDTPSGGVRVELLDPLEDDLEPGPLAEVLADPGVEVVLHAARQDVALLKRVWETEVRGVFDTQLAAGFAGLRAQMGYDALLRDVLKVGLEKSASFTRWDQRPLTDEQLRYAAEDVQHLLQLAGALQERLERAGRLGWAREECRALEAVEDRRDPETLFERLPRVDGLDPAQRAVALELVRWREETARDADRPPSTVLQDAALVELAKRRPKSRERLAQIRGVPEATRHRRGEDLVRAIAAGRDRPPIPVERARPPRSEPGDAPLVALAEALVRARAAEHGLAYELLASKADLQRVVVGRRLGDDPEGEVRTISGWRHDLVGRELLELLDGRHGLRVRDGSLVVGDA